MMMTMLTSKLFVTLAWKIFIEINVWVFAKYSGNYNGDISRWISFVICDIPELCLIDVEAKFYLIAKISIRSLFVIKNNTDVKAFENDIAFRSTLLSGR